MLNWEELMDISMLYKEGHSIKQIVRMTGYSRNTVRKALRKEYGSNQERKKRPSLLDDYKSYLKKRYEETGLTAQRLHEEILRLGYNGSYDLVRRFVKNFADEEARSGRLTVRFETLPGKQAQVDWGECGYCPDENGKMRKLYAFVMVLGYSRAMYVVFTFSMKLSQLLECHMNAFEYLGGVPDEILYDNMKQVRIDSGKLNPAMQDFASYYGFAIKTCRPYRARTKGKVERAIQFLKTSFFPCPDFENIEDANLRLAMWLESSANGRVHASTGEQPSKLLKEENLRKTGSLLRYKVIGSSERKTDFEGYVNYCGSRYSVPPEHAGKKVIVEHEGSVIRIKTTKETIIFEHPEAAKKGMTVSSLEHIAEMWKLSLRPSGNELRIPCGSANGSNELTMCCVETRPLSKYEEAI